MSKPIEWKDVSVESSYGTAVVIDTKDNKHVISVRIDGAEAWFRDPSTLESLAAELTKAAAALRKSQQVTFGDLKAGEWFKAVGAPFPARKLNHCHQADTNNAVVAEEPWGMCQVSYPYDSPVIRLRATFEEVKP